MIPQSFSLSLSLQMTMRQKTGTWVLQVSLASFLIVSLTLLTVILRFKDTCSPQLLYLMKDWKKKRWICFGAGAEVCWLGLLREDICLQCGVFLRNSPGKMWSWFQSLAPVQDVTPSDSMYTSPLEACIDLLEKILLTILITTFLVKASWGQN